MTALFYDALKGCWLRFVKPVELVQTSCIEEVRNALWRLEERVNNEALLAVGFVSYEASPAFDPALHARRDDSFPLLCFGLFREAEQCELSSADSSRFTLGEWNPSVSREEYDHAISKVKSYIQAGDTYQVNFSFRLRSQFSGDPFELFQQLAHAQPSTNGAFIETEEFAICSASPELFFSLDGEKIIARPMKGTAPRGLTLMQDKARASELRLSEKNRAENVMIVDMMRNDIGRIAETASVHVPSLFDVERYPTVWQMTSTVAAKTDASVTEILKALFPCASVTGAPKARTMEIIAELESTPRQIYTGAIGFFTPNRRAQFNVAIRTVLIDKQKGEAEYGVGGGVVWASTASGEYDECLTKARVLTDSRPQFSLFETMLFTPADGFFLLDEHLARLKDSAEYFGFPCHLAEAHKMLGTVTENCSEALRVKLTMAYDGSFSVAVHGFDVHESRLPVRVRLAVSPIDSQNVFLYHKTTHRTVYDDALAAAGDCDDIILWNERGEITESTIANVVVEIDGALCTPPVACGLLGGVFRAQLLKEGNITERIITAEEFKKASRIYLVNSLRKCREALLIE